MNKTVLAVMGILTGLTAAGVGIWMATRKAVATIQSFSRATQAVRNTAYDVTVQWTVLQPFSGVVNFIAYTLDKKTQVAVAGGAAFLDFPAGTRIDMLPGWCGLGVIPGQYLLRVMVWQGNSITRIPDKIVAEVWDSVPITVI